MKCMCGIIVAVISICLDFVICHDKYDETKNPSSPRLCTSSKDTLRKLFFGKTPSIQDTRVSLHYDNLGLVNITRHYVSILPYINDPDLVSQRIAKLMMQRILEERMTCLTTRANRIILWSIMLIENSMFEDSPNSVYQSIQSSLDPMMSTAKKDKIARAIVVEARHVLFEDFVERILDGEMPGLDESLRLLAGFMTNELQNNNQQMVVAEIDKYSRMVLQEKINCNDKDTLRNLYTTELEIWFNKYKEEIIRVVMGVLSTIEPDLMNSVKLTTISTIASDFVNRINGTFTKLYDGLKSESVVLFLEDLKSIVGVEEYKLIQDVVTRMGWTKFEMPPTGKLDAESTMKIEKLVGGIEKLLMKVDSLKADPAESFRVEVLAELELIRQLLMHAKEALQSQKGQMLAGITTTTMNQEMPR